MNDGNTIRKLRAIMFTDIVDYSKMMQSNESEALKLLQKHKDIVTEVSAKYGGKIIKHIGDEILVESESAVMLVYCAKELQKYFKDRNATVPKSRELSVRIGIHIGDVIMKDDDIYGDGVNIAARIRPLANPGGIVITHSVLILLGNQDDIKCSLIGNKKLKNITEKIKVYEVLPDSQNGDTSIAYDKKPLVSREKLLKVVLPSSMVALFVIVLLLLIIFDTTTDYEEEFYKGNFKAASEITKDFETVKNVKANYFNIYSSNPIDAGAIINYYKKMDSDNVSNAKAKFYMGLSNLYFSTSRSQLDTALVLLNESARMGLSSVFLDIAMLDVNNRIKAGLNALSLARKMKFSHSDNPLALMKCAETYKIVSKNYSESEKLFRKSLDLFPDYVNSYSGLAEIEFERYNYAKAKALADSALTINPNFEPAIDIALKISKSLGDFDFSRKVLEKLPADSPKKYIENARISLLENEPADALKHISSGLEQFPDKNDFIKFSTSIKRTILVSDSIQQIESSSSRMKNRWMDSWEAVSGAAQRENKPIIVAALDGETLSSKYLELYLLDRSVSKTASDAILYRVFRHKDHEIIKELGITTFPTVLMVNSEKETVKSLSGADDQAIRKEVVGAFVEDVISLNRRMIAINREIDENKPKTAKNFAHAEELALEFEMPVIVVLTSRNNPSSENYLKHTIFNPAFMKNYKRTIFLTIEDAEFSDVTKKYKVSNLPAVLFFDEDMNLISSKYGVMPQKVLADEISKAKLHRRRKEMLRPEINWVYDVKEALTFSKKDNKPVFVYYSPLAETRFKPSEAVFGDYDVIKRINSMYIPLFLRKSSFAALKTGIEPEILPYFSVLNPSGGEIYSTNLPEDPYELNSYLDFKTNSDHAVSLGKSGFGEMMKKKELLSTLSRSGLKKSLETELLVFITKYPSYPYGLVNFAEFLMSVNNFASSTYYLKFLQNKDFLITDKFLQTLVSSYMLYYDFQRLKDLLTALAEKNKGKPLSQASVYSALAEVHFSRAETLEALNFAEKAYSLDPERPEHLMFLGILNHNINKSQSQKHFLSTLIRDPISLIANLYLYKSTSINEYFLTAQKSYYSGNSDFFGLRFFDLSKPFDEKGIHELKDRAYRLKLLLNPENPVFRLELIKFITEIRSDLAEALDMANTLLESDPNNPDYLSSTAWVFYNLGDFSGADRLITKALGFIPADEYDNYPDLFYYMGMIKSSIGDNRSALYYFEKLLAFKDRDRIDFNKIDYAIRFCESIQ
jgi:class 3 adenylate cyclase/tetratricopeptide (TPR) repeat protein